MRKFLKQPIRRIPFGRPHPYSTLIFLAEADRLEAGGLNPMIDIQPHEPKYRAQQQASNPERTLDFLPV